MFIHSVFFILFCMFVSFVDPLFRCSFLSIIYLSKSISILILFYLLVKNHIISFSVKNLYLFLTAKSLNMSICIGYNFSLGSQWLSRCNHHVGSISSLLPPIIHLTTFMQNRARCDLVSLFAMSSAILLSANFVPVANSRSHLSRSFLKPSKSRCWTVSSLRPYTHVGLFFKSNLCSEAVKPPCVPLASASTLWFCRCY